jgi:hypothetical protein
MRSSLALTTLVLCVFTGCGGDGGGGDDDGPMPPDAAPGGPTAVFAPHAPGSPQDFGAIPYPSDLFLDAGGHLAIGALPLGALPNQDAVARLKEALATLNGAGVWSNVYFPIAGTVDPAALAGQVHLVDLDAATPSEVPVDAYWRADLAAVVLVPQFGTVLRQDRRYGAYITTAVAARPAGMTAALADAAPADPALAAAHASLAPLRAALGAGTADVAAATVFRTHSLSRDLEAMRDTVAAQAPVVSAVDAVVGPAAAELDAVFGPEPADHLPGMTDGGAGRGQPHQHVKVVVHGTIGLPSFVAATPNTPGQIEHDAGGAPVVKATHPVKFTLILPDTPSWADVPVVLYVHGIGRTRADMLVQAETVTARGWALLAVDLLYHGARSNNPVDTKSDVTFAMAPDGFADVDGLLSPANYFDLTASGSIPRQLVMRAHLMQSAMDLVALATYVRLGDPAPLRAALVAAVGAPLANGLSFQQDRVAVVAESFGAMLAGVAIAVEPTLGAAVLTSSAGGFPWPSLLHSGNYAGIFDDVVYAPWDVASRVVLGDTTRGARVEPMVMFYNSALEQGDPIAYAPYVLGGALRGDQGPSVLYGGVWCDEWVPNESTEFLMRALGVPEVKLAQPMTPPGGTLRFTTLPAATAPVSGNVAGGARTASFSVWYPAGHAFLRQTSVTLKLMPPFPVVGAMVPFPLLPEEMVIPQPIVKLHAQYGDFLAGVFGGGAGTIADPYAP